MPFMCQCAGECGEPLCCRGQGRRRKQSSEGQTLCGDCRGGEGRDRKVFRKRPAAAVGLLDQQQPPMHHQQQQQQQQHQDVLCRIATALEHLAARPGNPVGGSLGTGASGGLAEMPRPQSLRIPALLDALLASVKAAGPGSHAGDILDALGCHSECPHVGKWPGTCFLIFTHYVVVSTHYIYIVLNEVYLYTYFVTSCTK
jgi:hypothetical protein